MPLHYCQKAEDTLILAHVMTRHGHRTTDMDFMFPTYTFNESSFYPYGPGELTLKGKKEMVKVGKALRERYCDFLGACYQDGLVEAVSSEYKRTMMSIQSVLAGLFIPSNDCELKGNLSWQPVPFKYIPKFKDKFTAVHKSCPKVLEVQAKMDDDEKDLYKYISKHTGLNVTTSFHTFFLYWSLENLNDLGFEVPKWSIPIWKQLQEKHSTQFYIDLIEQNLKMLTGSLMVKIHEDSQKKIKNMFKPKMVIYSGHDINIVGLLGACGIFKRDVVNFGSYVIIELHKIEANYYVKVIYENYKFNKPEVMVLPKCSEFCEFEKFVAITKKVYPNENWCS
ncbi:PREDICTED: venom acid phosphatase Acph-1-like [Nicrophorus vespilloides]|uniref:acid phosphatase n=1 Tax=Nicrophorus vespilloides TaxID=110193 RepID=A0ABM1N1K5_NICVS|nr:PREDICTED: venom acid phosphatase Acph-1-like [Nicrophorus vespilloides]